MATPFRLLLAALLALAALICPVAAQQGSQALQDLLDAAREHYRAGDLARSLEASERALALTIRELGAEHEQVAIQTFGIGFVAERAGRLDLAERHFAHSVRVREKVYGAESPGTAQAIESRGQVLVRLGRAAEAEPLFRRVLKIRQDAVGAGHAFTASGHSNLADVSLAKGDAPAALAGYREAIRLLISQDTSTAVVKSIVEDGIRRHRDTFTGLARAAWALRGAPGQNAAALIEETFAATQQAWQTSAASALAKMTARIGAGDSALGQRIRRTQDLANRILALQADDMQSLADWSRVQRSYPDFAKLQDEFRAASIAKARDGAPNIKRQRELVEALQAELARCPPGQKKTGCEESEKRRNAITGELGQLSQASAGDGAAIMAVHQRMEAAERALPGYAAFQERRNQLRAAIDGAEREAREARAEIVRGFPQYLALSEPKPLTIAEVQALLGPEEALIAYLAGASQSFAWVITRERADWALIEVSAEELARTVGRLRAALDPGAEPDSPGPIGTQAPFDHALAHQLYRQVLAPVAPAIAGKSHLIVVPAGPLARLPFQVLVTAPPAEARTPEERNRSAAWLVKSTALSVLPSVPALHALRRLAPQGAGSKPFLGVGDPVLQGLPGEQRSAKRNTRNPARFYRNGLADLRAVRELEPLPDTADEIRTIAGVLGASSDDVLLRQQASEARIKARDLSAFRVLHFATHGLVAGDLSGVDEPALVLTPPDRPTEVDDGLLTASEIAALRLNADWVVLSACNTAAAAGDSDGQGADALSGLARAFFYAGARTLLVSHWAVYSAAATELTTQTFKALSANAGMGRAQAFRQSMLALIAQGRPPSYWAPFVIVGEGGTPAR